jgi:hypothetical protein
MNSLCQHLVRSRATQVRGGAWDARMNLGGCAEWTKQAGASQHAISTLLVELLFQAYFTDKL